MKVGHDEPLDRCSETAAGFKAPGESPPTLPLPKNWRA